MATITQGPISQNIMFRKNSNGDSDVFYRLELRQLKIVAQLGFLAQVASATINIYGGNTEASQTTLLATITLSTNGNLLETYDIYGNLPYIKATLSSLSGTGANVTISANAVGD